MPSRVPCSSQSCRILQFSPLLTSRIFLRGGILQCFQESKIQMVQGVTDVNVPKWGHTLCFQDEDPTSRFSRRPFGIIRFPGDHISELSGKLLNFPRLICFICPGRPTLILTGGLQFPIFPGPSEIVSGATNCICQVSCLLCVPMNKFIMWPSKKGLN